MVQVQGKLHPTLLRRLAESADGGRVKAWVLFLDKDLNSVAASRSAVHKLEATYNPRAIQRRRDRRINPGLFDEHDLPVAQRYLDAVAEEGVQLRHVSNWINGVSVLGSAQQFVRIAGLPFVRMVQPVRRGRRVDPTKIVPIEVNNKATGDVSASGGGLDYGLAFEQLDQINLTALHELGYTGTGVVVGILDTGFQRSHVAFNSPTHPLTVLAEWDFIDNDGDTSFETGDPAGQHSHGTLILGTLGAYRPGELVGAAYDASFILCKTEDTTGEYPAEEDNYVAGLEFIEANGGDVATSSLSYLDWYTSDDMDGLTAVTTIAVNVATANGVYCCTAAGNSGHDSDPTTLRLGAPADALKVLTCGAVDSGGVIASFSTDGPTTDGRVKPEVLARGINTLTVSSMDDATYVGANGTSLSTPLVAGAVACLAQAHPEWTVVQLRTRLTSTASHYRTKSTFDPLYVYGYGIIDAFYAHWNLDCNGNGTEDVIDLDAGVLHDADGNGIPDECGACCGQFGCDQMTGALCSGQATGQYNGDGTVCRKTCLSGIPTVSSWGLVTMTLLILVGGTCVLTNRRTPWAT